MEDEGRASDVNLKSGPVCRPVENGPRLPL